MKGKIAIIYTTFLRDELMKHTIKSIKDNWHECYTLLIGDQASPRSIDRRASEKLLFNGNAMYLPLPFDFGLSASRNELIFTAKALDCKYCLITADSIAFSEQLARNIYLAQDFLALSPDIGILGFDLENRVPWEWRMSIKEQDSDRFFELTKADELYIDPDTRLGIVECDICRNFFLAKIDMLLDVLWDPRLKLSEHEDFFWRYKQAGYGVAWTPDISGIYMGNKFPQSEEYQNYRKRCYTEFQPQLLKKYNLTQWARYKR